MIGFNERFFDQSPRIGSYSVKLSRVLHHLIAMFINTSILIEQSFAQSKLMLKQIKVKQDLLNLCDNH